ncbi:hypothetical protein [Rickettsiales endosymbiont of Stachyamoeba lipophora]|uniref:hypothetical protein n=1 Tax=Rickettsiales endosymbiont of Stachyamoeba lipophora TaxID=2486578 RepID=UPI000F650EA9|nr:hypothetical protein [Rickettsiales endosymbiont of Stachyamoeba lipophora]AZL15394.1 hypothetical protein EF513_02335 [Rickettsiales endosymbiont of Stachyamoeba lipophora]
MCHANEKQHIAIKNLSEIKQYIGGFAEDDLVVFDIDGVIINLKDIILNSNNREIRHKYFEELKQK